jgi:hypothetical protein
MYLGGILVDAVAVDQELISKPGYLGAFKRAFKEKHQGLLQQTKEFPQFLVESSFRSHNCSAVPNATSCNSGY